MNAQIDNIIMENAKIVHRNFSGKVDTYNKSGNRTFSLVISDHEDAKKLIEEGWYLKQFKPRSNDDPEAEPDYFLPVTVSYKSYPPKIYVVSKSGGKTNVRLLKEDEVGNLDDLEISSVDLTIRPYCWEVRDQHGVRAYLKTMYVNLLEDEFAYKYSSGFDEEI